MNARLWPSLGLALFLAASLALKVRAVTGAEVDTTTPVVTAARAFLERQGLTVLGTRTNLDLTVMGAERAPDCRLVLANMAPQGWHAGVLHQVGRNAERMFFVFDGAISAAQPTLGPRLRLYVNLIERQLGLSAAFHPLLGVVADAACGAERYPWADLAAIPLSGGS